MTIPEELLPVIEWWEKDGKQTLAIVAAAAVVVAGYYGVKNWRQAQREAAGSALMEAAMGGDSVESLESAVAAHGSSASGPALKLRLAKAYYDAGQYDDKSYQNALEIYTELDGKAPDGFAEVPKLGIAACLEGLGRTEEAQKAYDEFVEALPESPYALQAKLGSARCTALAGDKAKALEKLAALKDEVKDDDASLALVETAEDVVKRWEKRERAPSATDELANTLEAIDATAEEAASLAKEAVAAPAPEAAPSPVAEPEPAPAPEAPAAVEPAPAPEAPAAVESAPAPEAPAAVEPAPAPAEPVAAPVEQ